jgi:hypothetical protein
MGLVLLLNIGGESQISTFHCICKRPANKSFERERERQWLFSTESAMEIYGFL